MAGFEQAHVDIFNKGAAAWNEWRAAHPDLKPRLSGGDLEWTAGEYDLSAVSLEATDLPAPRPGLAIRGLTWTDKPLSVDFRKATLVGADFSGADLSGSQFNSATLRTCKFVNASFGIKAEHGLAERVTALLPTRKRSPNAGLRAIEFQNVKAHGCDFRGSSWVAVSTWSSHFVECDMRDIRKFRVDGNVFRETLVSPQGGGAWFALRRTYSGANMALVFVASLFFFLPWAVDAAFLAAKGRARVEAAELMRDVETRLEQRAAAEVLPEAWRAAMERVADPDVLACVSEASRAERSEGCRPLWQVLLGFHEGFWGGLLGTFLLVFNATRLGLTWMVAPLRDEEVRTFHAPELRPPSPREREGKPFDPRRYYGWMVHPHQALTIVGPLLLVFGALKLGARLIEPTWAP